MRWMAVPTDIVQTDPPALAGVDLAARIVTLGARVQNTHGLKMASLFALMPMPRVSMPKPPKLTRNGVRNPRLGVRTGREIGPLTTTA